MKKLALIAVAFAACIDVEASQNSAFRNFLRVAAMPITAVYSSAVVLANTSKDLQNSRYKRNLVLTGNDDNVLAGAVIAGKEIEEISSTIFKDTYTSKKPLKFVVDYIGLLNGGLAATPVAQTQTPTTNYLILNKHLVDQVNRHPDPWYALSNYVHESKFAFDHECGHQQNLLPQDV